MMFERQVRALKNKGFKLYERTKMEVEHEVEKVYKVTWEMRAEQKRLFAAMDEEMR